MTRERTINGLDHASSSSAKKDQILKVAGKMIASSIAAVNAGGVVLKASGDALDGVIVIRQDLEDDLKQAVTNENTSEDDGVQAYKAAIQIIADNIASDADREGMGVVLSKIDEKQTICMAPSNCHASHGDPAHSVDAICNTDKNRKYLKARITAGLPDVPGGYVDVDVIKETGKHVLFLLPEAFRNIPLWIILTPWNTFGKGNDSNPFKCDPMS